MKINLFLAMLVLIISRSNINAQPVNWVTTYGGTSTSENVIVKDIRESAVGPVEYCVAVGYFVGTVNFGCRTLTSIGGKDGFVLFITQNGTQVAVAQIGGTGDDIVYDVDDITYTSGSGPQFVVAGSFEGSCVLYNPSTATQITMNAVAQKDMFYAVINGNDFLSTTEYFYTAQSFGGAGNDEALSVSRAGARIALTGYFDQSIAITSSLPGTYNAKTVSTNGGKDIALIMVDRTASTFYTQTANQNAWMYGFGGSSDDVGTSLMFCTGAGLSPNLTLAGYIESSSAFFNLPSQVRSLATSNMQDIFFGEIPLNYSALPAGEAFDRWSYLYSLSGPGNQYPTKIFNQNDYIILTGSFENYTNFRVPSSTYTLTSFGGTDGFIAAYRRTRQWSGTFTAATIAFATCHQIGGTGNDIINNLASDYLQTSTTISKFIACGTFESTANVTDISGSPKTVPLISKGNKDMLFVRYLPTSISLPLAQISCINSMGGTGDEEGNGVCCDLVNDGTIISGSFTQSFTPNNGTTYSPSSNMDGIIANMRCCNSLHDGINLGGTDYDEARAIVRETGGSNDIYIGGTYANSTSIPLAGGGSFAPTAAGGLDGMILKMNSSYGVVWGISLGGTGTEYITSIAEQGNYIYAGGYYDAPITIGGNTYTPCGIWDMFIVCYDKSGTFQWFTSFGGTDGESLTRLVVDNSGNVYVTGPFYSRPIYFGNCSVSPKSNLGYTDTYLAKYNSSGVFQWGIAFGSSGIDQPYDLIYNNTYSELYLTGFYEGTVNFGANSLTAASGNKESYLAKFDPATGINQWAQGAGCTSIFSTTVYETLLEDNSGDIVCIGSASGSTIGFSGSVTTLAGHPDGCTFLAKYSPAGSLLAAKQIGNSIGSGMGYGIINSKARIDGNNNIFVAGSAYGNYDFYNNVKTRSLMGGLDLLGYKISPGWDVICAASAGSFNDDIGYDLFTIGTSGDAIVLGLVSDILKLGNQTMNMTSDYYQIGLIKFKCCD